jgi:hypothetical protein
MKLVHSSYPIGMNYPGWFAIVYMYSMYFDVILNSRSRISFG